uniref:Integrase catalytic domain-containing protein n=1 Tax=Plectus sambesii TaxID=2011161 RepID=A0A914WW83_9BILA
MVREMLERGLIIPSDGVWSAPLLIVCKKSDVNSTDPDSPHFRQNDQFRVVIDYRQTNKLLKNCINLPTPRTDVCCQFSKYTMAFALNDIAAPTIAHTLVTRVFLVFGVPEVILSDMGTSLIGNVMQEVYKLLGIKKLTSSPAQAQTCGQVEKMNGVLIRIIQAFVARDQHDWPAYIPFALMAINSSVAAHNDTQHFLVFGHDLNIPPLSAFTYRPSNLIDSNSYAIATADRLTFAWE